MGNGESEMAILDAPTDQTQWSNPSVGQQFENLQCLINVPAEKGIYIDEWEGNIRYLCDAVSRLLDTLFSEKTPPDKEVARVRNLSRKVLERAEEYVQDMTDPTQIKRVRGYISKERLRIDPLHTLHVNLSQGA